MNIFRKVIFSSIICIPLSAISQNIIDSKIREEIAGAVKRINQSFVKGDLQKLKNYYHPKSLSIGPHALKPLSKEESLKAIQGFLSAGTMKYLYERNLNIISVNKNSVIVAFNYESGFMAEGELIEQSGKAIYVLGKVNQNWVLQAEVYVPNLTSGSFGAMGNAIKSKDLLGMYPTKQVEMEVTKPQPVFREKTEIALLEATKRINKAFVNGNVDQIMVNYSKFQGFSIGDFSHVYLFGHNEVKQHFIDFFETGKMQSIDIIQPVIRVFNDIGIVSFIFDSKLTVNGQDIRSPGISVYIFTRDPNGIWRMSGCTETSLVDKAIGQPMGW